MLHRDLKLGKLLLTEKLDVKLADFVLATILEYEGERKRTICGTPNYIAPEVLEGNHSYEADIWSLGVILYTLLVGYPPFQTSNIKTTYKRIKSSVYAFPDYIPLSTEAKDLISLILVNDPSSRIDLNSIFGHNFFTKNEIPTFIPLSSLAIPPHDSCFKQSQIEKNKSFEFPELSTSSSEELKIIEGVWVEKWIKNGSSIGYFLNNFMVGVCFDDDTQIIGNNQEFLFVDKKKSLYNIFIR